ncbi:hypothetical protein M378DRAFT_182187 [Amanita muscaria Koide BX008]|uniref:Uncharacterized protein n=1 Tax=Amanita muscaria (strain Koide BX008) TaxID=946122 RepID=A0A0C2WHN3_AMAMK|nr:hypothetical protein M378DRAFT_182187 [Amanita muscaria Koide BX008]
MSLSVVDFSNSSKPDRVTGERTRIPVDPHSSFLPPRSSPSYGSCLSHHIHVQVRTPPDHHEQTDIKVTRSLRNHTRLVRISFRFRSTVYVTLLRLGYGTPPLFSLQLLPWWSPLKHPVSHLAPGVADYHALKHAKQAAKKAALKEPEPKLAPSRAGIRKSKRKKF